MNATGPNVVAFTQLTITTEFHSCAAFSCLLYDFVLSMDDEITLIWRSADTIPKFLYFVSRYLGLAVQACLAFTLFPAYCVNFMVFNTATLFVLMLSVELSLMLRLYALYGRNRIVFYILVFSIIGEIAAVFAMDITAFPQFYHLAIHYPSDWPVRGCFYPEVLSFFKVCWLPLLGFETLLFVLMTIRCLTYGPLRDLPILLCVWRDGTLYYFLILVTLLLCTIAPHVSSIFLADWAAIWVSAILSYSGSHFLLNIRSLAAERRCPQVMTPMLSEQISDTSPESVAEVPTPITPSHEAFNLLPWSTQRTPVLANSEFLSATVPSAVPESKRRHEDNMSAAWLRQWEVTSFDNTIHRGVPVSPPQEGGDERNGVNAYNAV